MKILAVDTSSNACSVALQISGDILEKHVVEPRAHTRILMPMISELLADGDLALSELDAIVLGNGPGSFIGMRIGASVVQGLCYGAGLPVVPVSSLAAIAVEAFSEFEIDAVVVAQDARMSEVYLASFKRGQAGLPEMMGVESIVAVGQLPVTVTPYAIAGAAWERYPELIEANSGSISSRLPISLPRARHLLPPGQQIIDAGRSISPEMLIPAYLRTKVAEKPTSGQQ